MILSIIIPVYNVEMVLNRCIESIINQTYEDFELILVDDGSKDSSGIICDSYAKLDSRVKVLHKENGGVSSARNYGLEYAIGRYVQFVDSDDYLDPDMCFLLINNIEMNKSDMVICGYRIVSNNKINSSYSMNIPCLHLHKGHKEFIELYNNDLINSPCNKLYKKEKINNLKFLDNLSLGEDLIFNLSYLQDIETITCIPEVLYNYVYDNLNSLTKKIRTNIFDIMFLLDEKICEFYLNKFGWNKDLNKLNKFLIRDIFNGLQRVIIESDLNKKNKLIMIKYVIENNRLQTALINNEYTNFQIKLFCLLLKTKNKYLIYYLFVIKRIALHLYKRNLLYTN